VATTDNKPKFEHYWMCADCAEDFGGKLIDSDGITTTMGKCKYCKMVNGPLIPWVDFDWNNAELDKIAKLTRD